jgi:hypothetical protein
VKRWQQLVDQCRRREDSVDQPEKRAEREAALVKGAEDREVDEREDLVWERSSPRGRRRDGPGV